jgi:hypothetical protein
MTVRADDIALGGLGKDARQAGAANHGRYPRDLDRGIPMIEVHRALGKSTPAIGARDGPELIKDLCVVSPARPMILRSR